MRDSVYTLFLVILYLLALTASFLLGVVVGTSNTFNL